MFKGIQPRVLWIGLEADVFPPRWRRRKRRPVTDDVDDVFVLSFDRSAETRRNARLCAHAFIALSAAAALACFVVAGC